MTLFQAITLMIALAALTLATVRFIQDRPKPGKGRHAIGRHRRLHKKR
ncbi:hypothetical protein [Nocardiopsis sp. CC223A]|nr:hypothetical protein [Nocardiopsis sp. CC223A]